MNGSASTVRPVNPATSDFSSRIEVLEDDNDDDSADVVVVRDNLSNLRATPRRTPSPNLPMAPAASATTTDGMFTF